MNYNIHRASKGEAKQVVERMLSGVSSDPTGMAELRRNWWQWLVYRYLVAPRMLRGQMDTFVAAQEGELQGYLVVQYTGGVAGTFDWAVLPPLSDVGSEILADLLDAALDRVEEQETFPHFYFGLMADVQEALPILDELGFYLLDYQQVQVVADLPLAEGASLPAELTVSPQMLIRVRDRFPELIGLDYPEERAAGGEDEGYAADPDITASVHHANLGAARFFLVEQDEEAVGLVQQNRWRDELRLLLSLKPELWNTPLERQLVAALPGFLGGRVRRVRVRSFSRAHLTASRPGLESLGLRWEESPWHRWLVHL